MKTIIRFCFSAILLIAASTNVDAQLSWVSQPTGYWDTGGCKGFADIEVLSANTAIACGGVGQGWLCPEEGVIYKTTNGGNTWVKQNLTSAHRLIGISFPTATVGYAVGLAGAIWKSTDAGVNWTAQSSGITGDLTHVFFLDATTGYAAGASGKIIKTTNGGSTWTNVPSGVITYIASIFFIDANTGWFCASNSNNIYKTTNGGTTWTAYNSNTLEAYYVFFCNATTGYATCRNKIVKTTDGGLTYSTVFQPDSTVYDLWFSDTQNGWLVGGYYNFMYHTTNGGATWSTVVVGDDSFLAIDGTASNNIFAVGTQQNAYHYTQTYSATFHVKDNLSNPINGASVTFNGSTKTTNVSGNATFSNFVAGTYNYSVTKSGFTTYSGSVVEPGNDPVQVTLQPSGYTVTFHVKDNANAPIQSAQVSFNGQTLPTDATGLVNFVGVSAGSGQAYSISKSGYTPASGTINVTGNQTLNVTLSPASYTYNINFHVKDNTTNADIQGASVTFNGSTQITDASGFTDFSGVTTGVKSYAVNKSGYDAYSNTYNVISDNTVTVNLVPTPASTTVDFHVYNNSSNPINGAVVVFDGVTQNTNASGQTTFTNVSAGNIHYTVTASGYIAIDDYINEPGNNSVNISMTAVSSGSNIGFYVYNNSSTAINAAQVTFNGVTQYTNASGYTLFSNVPAGSINYEVVKAGYITSTASVTEPGNNPVSVYLTAAGSGLTINFYVYRPGLWGIDGATVTFNGVTQYTDASGNTAFNDVPTGNLYYEISKPGYVSVSNYISEPGNDPIALVLTPCGADINFWVYDNLTNPINGATVTFDGVTQTTDASGNTVFINVATGNLYCEVTKPGYSSYTAYIDEPGNDPIVVTLNPSSTSWNVTFTVTNQSSTPIQNAGVTFNGATQYTNASGNTTFSGVPSGNYSYSIDKAGYDMSSGNITVSGNMT